MHVMNAARIAPVFASRLRRTGAFISAMPIRALLNAKMAAAVDGRFLLRIEDVDRRRAASANSRRRFRRSRLARPDLSRGAAPPERACREDYARAMASLEARGLVYPCFCTRGDIARMSAGLRDPDGAPLHRGRVPRTARASARGRPRRACASIWRARCRSTPQSLSWREYGEGVAGTISSTPIPPPGATLSCAARIVPASYHLAVVVDDALQGVSDVVRGARSLSRHFRSSPAAGISSASQAPRYRHHRLVRDASGAKMSKSAHR